MPRRHAITNLETGEIKFVDFTPEEEAARDAEEKQAAEEFKRLPYQVKRRLEYPDMGNQLDAIMKWINTGDIAEAKAMAERCLEVKRKHPKGG